MLRQPLFHPAIGRHYWESPASRWTGREEQEEGVLCQRKERLVSLFHDRQVLWARQKKKDTVRSGKFAEIKKDHKMTTNSNTKSYQTTLVQDPEVLAKPMDQILHWFRPRVAVEFPPLPPPAKMPCCGSENEMINEILTGFQDSEKLLKLITLKSQKKRACETWDLPANSLARDFPFPHQPILKNLLTGPPS